MMSGVWYGYRPGMWQDWTAWRHRARGALRWALVRSVRRDAGAVYARELELCVSRRSARLEVLAGREGDPIWVTVSGRRTLRQLAEGILAALDQTAAPEERRSVVSAGPPPRERVETVRVA